MKDAANPQVILIGTGSEVWPAWMPQSCLSAEGIAARVVSMPSWEIFDEPIGGVQGERAAGGVPKIAVEAGATLGWWKYVGQDGDVVGLDHFGASAPGPKVLDEAWVYRRERRGSREVLLKK